MKEALDGLQGVQHVQVDLTDNRFDVTFEPQIVTMGDLLAAVAATGFTPEIVATALSSGQSKQAVLNSNALPEDLQHLIRDAKTRKRLILLHFTGPD